MQVAAHDSTDGTATRTWPIFICYRRADGPEAARHVHRVLDKFTFKNGEEQVVLDVYLDVRMPGVGDWLLVHQPYLKKSRAIVVICTPELQKSKGADDWGHKEINWWLGKRTTAPILIDAFGHGARDVPDAIALRWPNAQRLSLVDDDLLRAQIVGAIVPSAANVYAQELENERRRARRLVIALCVAALLACGLAAATWYALERHRAALLNTRIADAARLDAAAAKSFAESRLYDARWDSAQRRRIELLREQSLPSLSEVRASNLADELSQLELLKNQYVVDAAQKRTEGNRALADASQAWLALERDAPTASAARDPPQTPRVFSIELINAGRGESLLIHFGSPEATSFLLINGGDRNSYRGFVEPRIREISQRRFEGKPVPIELFVVGDQDAEKTEGLRELLRDLASPRNGSAPYVRLNGIWANLFEPRKKSFRGEIRQRIEELAIPLNRPFDHHVMRPEQGRVAVPAHDGMEIVVLGPQREDLQHLHALSAREAKRSDAPMPRFAEEEFTAVAIDETPVALTAAQLPTLNRECRASENASRLAGGAYADTSVSNRASIVLLIRFGGRSFLYTGDARGDRVLQALEDTKLLDARQRVHVDLLSIPHMGSDRNVMPGFFEQVLANGYLFSGDGRHDNPELATVAGLIASRGCASYQMFFANRDGSRKEGQADDPHGKKFDEFFAAERQYSPNYQRVFRISERGSVVVDLLDPIRY